MSTLKETAFKSGLAALWHSRAHRLIEPFSKGSGLIFMLHHVRPEQPGDFAPNHILEVTPEFLDAVLRQTREAGLDIVTLDEAAERLEAGNPRRFACFTFDDGYRDNARHALPIFRKHGAPLAIYVPTDYADGEGELWWLALEEVIARADEVVVRSRRSAARYATHTPAEKYAAFDAIYWRLRATPEDDQRAIVRDLADAAEVDVQGMCRRLVMGWNTLREIATDPLVTIGAHTAGHYAVGKLPAARARQEMQKSADRIEQELGVRPRHFSFPYGDAGSAGARDFALAGELGFRTAVTTRKGMLFPEHREHLTALPRVSLNGDYQSLAYTGLYLGGAPFALWNRFRKVDAA